MLPIQMVDLKGQLKKIKVELNQAIEQVIQSSSFINGPEVKLFCDNLTTYIGSKYTIPCANGTDALQIAIQSLDLPKGSEIIVPTFNYIAAVEAISFLGYKPVFVDSNDSSFNIDPEKIESLINENTKALVAVHLFGQSCDMEQTLSIAKKHHLFVIEDNAQAIGTQYSFSGGFQKKTGTIGDIGTTSFFPSKNLGCMGDGGAIFTQNDDLAEKMKMIANHGQKQKYYHDIVGVNSRLDTLQATILDVKLKYLDSYIGSRQSAAAFYDKALSNNSNIIIPYRDPKSSHTFHQYTIQIQGGKRDGLKNFLQERGIPSMVYYPIPVHLQKAYKYLNYKKGDFPISEALCNKVLSLPMHTELDNEQLSYIAENVLNFLK